MNTTTNLPYVLLLAGMMGFTACEEEEGVALVEEIQAITVEDLLTEGERGAPDPTYYDLESNQVVDDAQANTTGWDIAFDNTSILVNSGISGPGQVEAQVIEGVFDDIDVAPESGYRMDADSALAIPAGSNNGWYTYTGGGNPPNAILPIPGRVIVLKTSDGNYAKLEVLSWYKGNPDTSTAEFANTDTRPEGRYFTFRYALQPNGSREF